MRKRIVTMVGVAAFVFASVPMALAGGIFTDVNDGDWYQPYVNAIYNAGMTEGYPDGTYGPNRNVTRAEMAAYATRIGGASSTTWDNSTYTKGAGTYEMATTTITVPGIGDGSQYVHVSGAVSTELTGSHDTHYTGSEPIILSAWITNGDGVQISPTRSVSLWHYQEHQSLDVDVLVEAGNGATTYKLKVQVTNINGEGIKVMDPQLIATTFPFSG